MLAFCHCFLQFLRPCSTGVAFCASAGEMSDGSGNESVHCLSEVGVAGDESTDGAANVWQPGSVFVFSPE